VEPGWDIAFFASSLVSAYWNGAATYYRGLVTKKQTLAGAMAAVGLGALGGAVRLALRRSVVGLGAIGAVAAGAAAPRLVKMGVALVARVIPSGAGIFPAASVPGPVQTPGVWQFACLV